MNELEYWQYLAKELLHGYEETVFVNLLNEGWSEENADREAQERICEQMRITFDEYDAIYESDYERAYNAFLCRLGEEEKEKEENKYA